jgi:hypothetical protein
VMLGIWMDTRLQSYGGGDHLPYAFSLQYSSSCSIRTDARKHPLEYNKFADGRKHFGPYAAS